MMSKEPNAVGTVTITAWYSGYEDKAAVAQFKVYSDSAVATAEPTGLRADCRTDCQTDCRTDRWADC